MKGEIVFAVAVVGCWIVLLAFLGYWARDAYRRRRHRCPVACPGRLAIEPAAVPCDRGRHRDGEHGNAAQGLTWSEIDGTTTVTVLGDQQRQITAMLPPWLAYRCNRCGGRRDRVDVGDGETVPGLCPRCDARLRTTASGDRL